MGALKTGHVVLDSLQDFQQSLWRSTLHYDNRRKFSGRFYAPDELCAPWEIVYNNSELISGQAGILKIVILEKLIEEIVALLKSGK